MIGRLQPAAVTAHTHTEVAVAIVPANGMQSQMQKLHLTHCRQMVQPREGGRACAPLLGVYTLVR